MTDRPKLLIISGIDGAGKTTVIKSLAKRLEKEGVQTYYIWLRYNHILLKPTHAFCRLVGLSRRRKTSRGKIWRHEFYRCQLFCSFYIFITLLDTWLSKLKMVWLLKNHNPDLVICDRWVNDIIIDLAVDSRRASMFESKWHKIFNQIIPPRAKQILITRKSDKILECRPECKDDPDFKFRQGMYRRLEDMHDKVAVVHNDGSIEQTVDDIWNHLGTSGEEKL